MTQNELDQHVKILGWLNVVFGVLYLLFGACAGLFMISVGALSGDPEAVPVLGVVAIFLGGFMLVMALPGLAAGVGLLKRRNWGRILAIIVGVLNIPNFPLGTAIGVYTLYVLLQSEAAAYFQGKKL